MSVPGDLYFRRKQCADASQRSIDAELLELLTSAVADHTVSRDLAETVASLSALDDAQLPQAARGRLTDDALHELESLHRPLTTYRVFGCCTD